MTRHAKSVSCKMAAWRRRDSESEKVTTGAAPPLRGAPVEMPSVGTRRSNRLFVSENALKAGPDDDVEAKVLRSGKRLALLEPAAKRAIGDRDGDGDADGWTRLLGTSGVAEQPRLGKHGKKGVERRGERRGREEARREKQGKTHTADELEPECSVSGKEPQNCLLKVDSGIPSLHVKAFGVVYSRKRRRSDSDGSDHLSSWKWSNESKHSFRSLSDGSMSSSSLDKSLCGDRFGVVFSRKPQKTPKLPSVAKATPTSLFECSEKELDDAVENFAGKIGILESDMLFGSVGHVVLVVVIQSANRSSSYRFTCFLVSILTWMMKKTISLFGCAAFVSSKSLARVFNLHGIHFLPVRHWKSDFSRRSAISDVGICIIFGARLMIPLVTVNFLVLPILFKSLHLSMSLNSLFLPIVLTRYLRKSFIDGHMEVSFEECRLYISHDYSEASTFGMKVISLRSAAAPDVEQASQILPANKVSSVAGVSTSAPGNTTVASDVRFQKQSRKRSSYRLGGAASHSLVKHRKKCFTDRQRGKLKVDAWAKICPIQESCVVQHGHDTTCDACLGEVSTEECVMPSSMPNYKRRNFANKTSIQRLKDLRIAFSESKNIDRLSCTANILVIESDRCWREEGAKVMLELSSSSEWCLGVKSGGTTRYLHKAQKVKPCATNRYNLAMVWTGASGWKLEFCEKKEWSVFKVLQRECCRRNVREVPVRTIPVPGVQGVSGYDQSVAPCFVRPHSYIHTVDEVERALMSENAYYDMDSGDEEWLKQLSFSSSTGDTDNFSLVTEDSFEKIISSFEKAAYIHSNDVSELEKATLCSNLGRIDMVAAVFDYWIKKRKQKHSTLVKVFQGQPAMKMQQIQKPLLRKKRSFKKQGNHAGRQKPERFKVAANQVAVRSLQEAESNASRAVDVAIQLRRRAQVLMMNADLATYKSVMALRLAESPWESDSPLLGG